MQGAISMKLHNQCANISQKIKRTISQRVGNEVGICDLPCMVCLADLLSAFRGLGSRVHVCISKW